MADAVTEVAPGVFQLRIPHGRDISIGYTLSYLVTGPNGHILIDTGMSSRTGAETLRDALAGQLGLKPGSVQAILITHNHPDHAGLVRDAKAMTGAKVAMHHVDWEGMGGMHLAMQPGGADRLRAWYLSHGVPSEEVVELFPHRRRPSEQTATQTHSTHGPGTAHPTSNPHAATNPGAHREAASVPAHSASPAGVAEGGGHGDPHAMEAPDMLLKGGESFSTGAATLEAVWTPGHTPGHLCFYDRKNGHLFTGDHILPTITSNVSLSSAGEGSPLTDYLGSVEKVGKLEVSLILPAHQHHFKDLRARVAELGRHHEARLEAVMRAAAGQPQTAYEIASHVPWNVGAWEKMEPGLRRAAVGETLSHLEHLQRRGKVKVSQDQSRILYALTVGR